MIKIHTANKIHIEKTNLNQNLHMRELKYFRKYHALIAGFFRLYIVGSLSLILEPLNSPRCDVYEYEVSYCATKLVLLSDFNMKYVNFNYLHFDFHCSSHPIPCCKRKNFLLFVRRGLWVKPVPVALPEL